MHSTVGVEANAAELSKLMAEVKDKDIAQLIEDGKKKLASLPAAGAAPAAAAPAAGGAPAAAKKEEKKEESEEEVRTEVLRVRVGFQVK
jgi:large subunit ribosomal protein LP2